MKRFITIVMFMFVYVTLHASAPADTIAVDNAKITKVIEHKTTTTKGKPTIKYYFLYNGELINTNKTTVDKYNLAKSYNAKCGLAMIIRGKNKRIVLN